MKTEPKAKLAARLDAIAAAIRELDQINAAKREDVERVKRECRATMGLTSSLPVLALPCEAKHQ